MISKTHPGGKDGTDDKKTQLNTISLQPRAWQREGDHVGHHSGLGWRDRQEIFVGPWLCPSGKAERLGSTIKAKVSIAPECDGKLWSAGVTGCVTTCFQDG